jgi:LysR family transcriptional regulator, nod-box dependent transcriptional activator
MRFKKLDLNLLIALDMLLAEKSVSRAAEKLFISQSAMSNSLLRLREYFEDPLLTQIGRKMELTPRAKALADPVRDVLIRVEATISTQAEFDPSKSEREFKLLVSDYTLFVLMPFVMQLALEQSATVKFKLVPQVDPPQQMLERGKADLMVIPQEFCSQHHPDESLYEETFVCLASKNSNIWGKEITEAEYLNAKHVLVQTLGPELPIFDNWFLRSYGVMRDAAVSTYSFASVPGLVSGTEFIATVHARLAASLIHQAEVKIMQPPVAFPNMIQTMQWHSLHSGDPGIFWLRQLLHKAVVRMDQKLLYAAT